MRNRIYPSLISADLLNLQKVVTELAPLCAGLHLDVMDFHFVPNLTFGPDFINALRRVTETQFWIDLLVDEPLRYFDRLELQQGDIVSVHYESTYPQTIFQEMRLRGWRASLALDPKTPIEVVMPFLNELDHVLLMSVPPGFSGQTFLYDVVEKLKKLHGIRREYEANFEIGMDGGLNATTLPAVLAYGVDTIAVAHAIFGSKDPIKALETLGTLS